MHRVERSVEIEAPLEAAFDRFSDFESFPRWMENIREVRRTGRGTTHWVSETAIEDLFAEWDAEVTVYEPDRRLVWRSARGDIAADGEAVFSVTPGGGTHLRVVLGFDTPLGRRGSQVSRFFGVRLGRQLQEDLERFKRIVERGNTGRLAGRGRRDERRESREARPFAPVAEHRRAPEREESRPRYALTPRERERERGRDRRDFDPRVTETFSRRGVDRLLGTKAGRGDGETG